ncbi:tetratricopeptide repeat protein [Sorangium sp. So ce302]|uniref:tetratricopeptide repeat protein n=1 Tax=Sorangium sp. So ce302 TaxID=3133297 RepID=UPI003F5DB534
MPVRVFISYAHEDDGFRRELNKHLRQLQRNHVIDVWHDRQIGAGEEWAGRISENLAAAQIILLLVSPDFIDSDYCVDVEVAHALDRHNRGEAVVIPVIVRQCAWDWTPFGNLWSLPTGGQPVNARPDNDDVWTEIVRELRAVVDQIAERQAAAPRAGIARHAPVLPAPGSCIGREAQVSHLADALLRDPAPRVAVLGPAGIGKTTVSLAALRRPSVVTRYGLRRYFVRLDAAQDADAAVAAMATALRVDVGPDLRRRSLVELARAPAVLVLDNLETPWEQDVPGTEALLAELAALTQVALMVSMRGMAQPGGISWAPPVHLTPLGGADAEEVFCAIAGQDHRRSDELRPLLAKQQGVPLAVTLLAHAAQGNDLANLAEEWNERRTALLIRGGRPWDRERSWAASLELSLTSRRMSEEARRLATLLGVLPDGVAQRDLVALLPAGGAGAARVLAQLALAHFEGGRLRVLAPVREHLRLAYPPAEEDIARAMAHYRALAEVLGPEPGGRGGERATVRLAAETANLQAMILRGLSGSEVHPWIKAARALTNFARVTGHMSSSVLDKALALARAAGDTRAVADCCWSIGLIAHARSEDQRALEMYHEALPLYRHMGDVLGEGNCLEAMGSIAQGLWRHEDARALFTQALERFLRIGNVVGEIYCIQRMAEIALVRSEHSTAVGLYERARALCEQHQEVLGEANCLYGLGQLALKQSQSKRARGLYIRALPLYVLVGDVQGHANCTTALGHIALQTSQIKKARTLFEQALSLHRQVGSQKGEADSLLGMGIVALTRSQPKRASKLFEQALSLYQHRGSPLDQAGCLRGLAVAAEVRSQHDKAQILCERAISLYRQAGDEWAEADCVYLLGCIVMAGSRSEQAVEFFERALVMFVRAGNATAEAECRMKLGETALRGGRRREARRFFKEALQLSRKIGNKEYENKCILVLDYLS